MSLHRDRITAPGMRDNDWAHAAADDIWFAAIARRTPNRARVADAAPVDPSPESAAHPSPRGDVSGATPYWE